MGTDLDEEQREYVTLVKSSADSLLSIINDILDCSKLEAGKLELESSTFNLRETVEEATKLFAIDAREKGLDFRCEVHPAVPESLAGDANRLRQVLVNLLGNALKFTQSGEVVLRIALLGSEAG